MQAAARYKLLFALKIAGIFGNLLLVAWLTVKGIYIMAAIAFAIAIIQAYLFYLSTLQSYKELDEFVEAVKYKDFSRHFNVRKAPTNLQPLRQGFNTINDTIKFITREKEAQYLYLQKMLEMVDTGILSYDVESKEIIWINDAFKKMTELPYLRLLNSLQRKNEALYHAILNLEPGNNSIVTINTDQLKVMLSATAFQTNGNNYKLVALQNINEALDENEARAWQKLLSVMTHEIMNSVAPISSLAQTLKQRLHHTQANIPGLEDVELGIETIQRRSEGLLKFAETYRNLNKINTPNLQEILIGDLFENIIQLLSPTLDRKSILIETILKDPFLKLQADKHLIEQVIINLLVNAIDAVKDVAEPKIILSAYRNNDNRIVIKISDNGEGIPQELLEKIFVPFFSTKKSGSGIGLNLCKQIMLLHKGNIYVRSEAGQATTFLLQF